MGSTAIPMFCLPQTTTYGILACLCLQNQDEAWLPAERIAAATSVPLPYLSKVLQALTSDGILVAKRGYRGGFRLSRPGHEISVMDVVKATDGRPRDAGCLLGLGDCSDEQPCPAHEFWQRKCHRIETGLEQISFADATWEGIVAKLIADAAGGLPVADLIHQSSKPS